MSQPFQIRQGIVTIKRRKVTMKNIKIITIVICTAFLAWQCTSEQEPLPDDCAVSAPVLALASSTDANCGLADGSITLTAGSIADGVTITVNGNPQTGANIQNLAAGSYLIVATSDGGCTTELTVEIQNADGVNATVAAGDSDCGDPTGTIGINATGGTGPYQYKLGDNAFQAEANFSGLAPGDYEVTVRDASGCEVVLQAEVTSNVSFGQINTIIQANCAIPGCHAGNRNPDLRVAANIRDRADRIMARTGARSMPPSGSGITLTDAEIEAIACWVADGAPGN